MKQLLIVCDSFPPAFAPRMGYLCKYLPSLGWHPTVVCEQQPSRHLDFLSQTADVHAVNLHPRGTRTEALTVTLLDTLGAYRDRQLYHAACQVVDRHRIDGLPSFDLVLCSTHRLFPLRAARRIAHLLRLPLVVDLRDILEEYAPQDAISRSLPTLFGLDTILRRILVKRYIRQRNSLIRHADAVTTVSQWHADLLQHVNANTHLIYNGYDDQFFFPAHTTSDHFTIIYTGRINSLRLRDPSLLLQALMRLITNGKVDATDIHIDWYIDAASAALLNEALQPYPALKPLMHIHEMVDALNIPSLLNASNIILLLANRSKADGPHGIMTTKLFESMAVERPVLCVTSDEAEIESTLATCHAGLAARDVDSTANFILTHYEAWKDNTTLPHHPDQNAIRQYARSRQARQFADIFIHAIETHRS